MREATMGESDDVRTCWTEPCRAAACAEVRCGLLARHARSAAPEQARAALAAFCEVSWPMVHATVRAQGYRGADAEDLTQAYFARFIERGDLAYAAGWQGCLRTFLRVSVRHFLSNERDRDRARKRGGGLRPLSLDAPAGDPSCVPEPACGVTPETLLAQGQAEAAIRNALQLLRGEMQRAGCPERLARVEDYLLEEVNTGSYGRMASEWGVGVSAARVTVHRLRKRLGRLLSLATLRPTPGHRGPRWA
jgi:DNA-directed RNA polymerase specialized sigma24 family protein